MKISSLFISKKTAECIRHQYPKGEAESRIRRFTKNKAAVCTLIFLSAAAVSVPVFITDHIAALTPVTQLKRGGYDEAARTVTLQAVTDDGYSEKISIDIKSREYSTDELAEYSKALDEKLWKRILGRNEDADNITYDLDLVSHIEGFPFTISWKSDKPLIINSKGKINTKELESTADDGGICVRLCAGISCGDYSEDKYSYVTVRKIGKPESESIRESIMESVSESDEGSRHQSVLKLPENAGMRNVRFYNASVNRGWAVLFAGVAAAALVMTAKDKKILDAAKERDKQMDTDYPNIVNRYILYLTAGMNPRTVWSAICKRYEEDVAGGMERRYAYEEMKTTLRFIEEGGGELRAYDDFAARCQNMKYRSFISLVKQTVEKGSDRVAALMQEEAEKACAGRCDRIKVMAAEAQTKLLLPMFMMLIVVIVIVMVPAFMGLNG